MQQHALTEGLLVAIEEWKQPAALPRRFGVLPHEGRVPRDDQRSRRQSLGADVRLAGLLLKQTCDRHRIDLLCLQGIK